MSLQHQDNGNRVSFSYSMSKARKSLNSPIFMKPPDTINANHTFVDDSLRGKGVADKLYQALIHFIQAKKLTLHPTCSYIARKWERTQSTQSQA